MRTVAGMAAEMRERELSLTGRAAWLAWQFAHGETFAVEDVMEIMRLSDSGAERMLRKLSQAIPIYYDNGRWQSYP